MLRTYRPGISGELALSQQPKKLSWHSGNDDDMILPKATSYFTHDACTFSTYILPCIITQPLFFKSPVIKKLVAQAMVDFHTTEGFFVLLFHGIFFHGENATCLSYLHGRTMELREQILSLVRKTCVICRLLFPCVNLSGSQAGQGERK